MHIHQLSVNYHREQDRLLIRVNTGDGDEFRVWLTRFLALRLRPTLDRILVEHIARQQADRLVGAGDGQTRKLLADIKTQEVLQKSDFRTPYRNQATRLPLGETPLLVTQLDIVPTDSGLLQLRFQEKLSEGGTPRDCTFTMEMPLAIGLQHLLDKGLAEAQWDVPGLPDAAARSAAADDSADESSPRYLN